MGNSNSQALEATKACAQYKEGECVSVYALAMPADIRLHVQPWLNTYACVCACICVCVDENLWLYVYMCVCVSV
jgi:hypothetical protein